MKYFCSVLGFIATVKYRHVDNKIEDKLQPTIQVTSSLYCNLADGLADAKMYHLQVSLNKAREAVNL